ncbi:hypothetical protein [Dapis sp. BLCC M172]|uniref:hypothetical protein n=1 Tax=Dapis sp. BLCC M172 TaxID=2975281 RepID=UPI003CF33686
MDREQMKRIYEQVASKIIYDRIENRESYLVFERKLLQAYRNSEEASRKYYELEMLMRESSQSNVK